MNENNLHPRLFQLKEVDSTSLYLRRMLVEEDLPEGSLVVADFQNSGRGQIGNVWESEDGKNMLFRLLIRADFLLADQHSVIINADGTILVYICYSETDSDFVCHCGRLDVLRDGVADAIFRF